MLKLFIIIIIFIVMHALYNLINYLRFPKIEELLINNYTDNSELRINAKIHKNEIINYIKYSGIKDQTLPAIQPLGYGQLASGQFSVFQNILNPREDIARIALDLVLEAKGNYWLKFKNSFNIFYWIRMILFIPKNISSYLGLNSENIITKLFQLLYWSIGIIFTFLISVYPEEIKNLISSFIDRF